METESLAATTAAVAPAYLSLRASLRRYVARRVSAEHVEDLVQEVLLRLHLHAGELHDASRLPGWAFRVAQSVVVDHHRRRRPEVAVELEEWEEPAEEPAGNVNEVVAGWLRPMIALLPAEYGEAVELVDVQGLSQREYAERAGLSLSGAKSRVQRGRRMLEEVVRRCCDLETDSRGNILGYTPRNCGCAREPKAGDRCG